MKTDLYTKSILTIIAVCLTINVITQFDFIPSAYASKPTNTTLVSNEYILVPVNEFETIDVRIVDINTYDELNVNIKGISTSDEIKVNINSIDTTDELDINIDEIGGGWLNHGGPIPVKIKE